MAVELSSCKYIIFRGGALQAWARCGDVLHLHRIGILCGWALLAYLRLGTAGILGSWALQASSVVWHGGNPAENCGTAGTLW